ncbi:MAG: aldo/keto reductase [Lachnospiraceae bacterium]|nr:aldo/keto reductase [Lachnospiraceae bacterium]
MKYINLQGYQETIKVSRLAMGSAMSMMRLSDDVITNLFDIYLDAGGNCLDTARSYGEGKCEALVANYLKKTGKRNQVVLTTKGCHPRNESMNISRLGRGDMTEDINLSLETFGVDYFDLYWIHKDDESIPVEEIVDNMNAILVKPGKVRALGCSNWHKERIEAANKYAKESGQAGFLTSQIQWSLAETKEEYFKDFGAVVMDDAAYHWYLENQIPVFAFSSQAQGFFPRAAAGIETLPPMMQKNYVNEANKVRLERVKALAEVNGMSLSAPTLGFIVNNRLPSVAIIGAENPDMLRQSLEGAEISMTADDADALFLV